MREKIEQLEHHSDIGANAGELALAAWPAVAVRVAIADLDAIHLDRAAIIGL